MPTSPPRLDAHDRGREKRVSAAARGYNRAWAKLAAAELRRAPFCAVCGKTFPRKDLVRDHVIPHRGNERLFRDPKNRQTLCRWCHGKKTAAE